MKRLALLVAAAAGILPLSVSASDWNGFYAGVQGAAATYSAKWNDINYDWFGHSMVTAKDKILPGAQVGYNRQYGSVVYGLEFDYRSGAKRVTRYSNDVYKTDDLKSLMTFRLRAGLAADRSLLYGTFGAGPRGRHPRLDRGRRRDRQLVRRQKRPSGHGLRVRVRTEVVKAPFRPLGMAPRRDPRRERAQPRRLPNGNL
jgi:hypothetical protein